MDTNSLKGFYDRYPDDFSDLRYMIDTVENVVQRFGFKEINTPALERRELYELKSGEEILEQTYSFTDKNNRKVTLTPEQTPTRARLIQNRRDLKSPVKWFDTSKRWRYESVQKGRDREFFQTDVDIFGSDSIEAEAEIIACAGMIFKEFGVEDRVKLLLNDRRILDSILSSRDITNVQEVMRVVDKKEKLSDEEYSSELKECGLKNESVDFVKKVTELEGDLDQKLRDLKEISPDDENVNRAIERMERLAEQLECYGVKSMCRFDASVVRGLDYYTGLVFEAFDRDGKLRSLFGGGRYDELVGEFGGQTVPAVGFGFGYSTTRILLEQEDALPSDDSTDVFVASVSNEIQDVSISISQQLRNIGLKTETKLTDRSLGGQLSYVDDIGSDFTIIVGERDLKNGVVTIRDMRSGDETKVNRGEIVGYLSDKI